MGQDSFRERSENDKSTSSTHNLVLWSMATILFRYDENDAREIELNQGIPEDIDEPDYLDVSQRNLIVLDDLMAHSGKDKRIADLFTKGSHHRNLSIIYIVQNVFHQGKEMRNISLNAHYIVLFKSPRDRQQISILARQVNPDRVQEFMKSYENRPWQTWLEPRSDFFHLRIFCINLFEDIRLNILRYTL